MNLSFDQITNIVKTRQFDRLIGEVESEFLDVKGALYPLSTNREKRELAKDVSAFANAGGGYILIGFVTKRAELQAGEQIEAPRFVPRSEFKRDQYEDVLRHWLHPVPTGINVQFVEAEENPDKGVVVILVPAQSDRSKPFLIKRAIEDDDRTTEVLFGYAERRSDRSDLRTVHDLHHALKIGFNFDRAVSDRFDALESVVHNHFTVTEESRTVVEREALLADRLKRLVKPPTNAGTPALFLAAVPTERAELRTIFSDSSDSIRRSFEAVPDLRSNGWGLAVPDRSKLIDGEYLRLESWRKVLELYRDGCLLFAGWIFSEFLAWGDTTGAGRIHPLALVEVITNFARFYERVLADFRALPQRIQFTIGVRNLHANVQKISLPEGRVNNLGWATHPLEAPGDIWSKQLVVASARYSAERTAFELSRELYVWFGHADSAIPYTRGNGDDREIDTEGIKALR